MVRKEIVRVYEKEEGTEIGEMDCKERKEGRREEHKLLNLS